MRRALWVVVILAACGGGSGGGSPDLLGENLARADCELFYRCCDATELMDVESLGFTDEASCITTLGAIFGEAVAELQPHVDSGLLVFDGAAAQQCIGAIDADTCQVTQTDACSEIFVGTLADGAPCQTFDVSVNFLRNNSPCASGICQCSEGCPIDGPVMGICEPARRLNEPCGFDNCERGLVCAFDQSGGVSVCKTPLANGESCADSSECSSGFCDGTCTVMAFCDGQ